jgi:hypothetical protein
MDKIMTTLKKCAAYVCQDLAGQIFSGDVSQWQLADRIEKRFKLQGATQTHLNHLKKQNEKFKREERRRHDFQFPDRLSYLWR